MGRHLLRWFLLLAGLAVVWDFAHFSKDLRSPTRSPELGRVDLIAVLTGGQRRLQEAFVLLEQGRGRYLFISGIEPGVQLVDILRANHIDPQAEKFRNRIFLDESSRSTVENAVEIRTMLERLHAHSLLLVTSDYHLHRALSLVRNELARPPALKDIQVYDYAVASPNFSLEDWWQSFTGWRVVVSEYLKTRAGQLGF